MPQRYELDASDMIETCLFDTETAGLHSPAVILQYAFDSDDPVIHDLWNSTAGETRALFRRMVRSRVVAHNLTFDWAKIQAFWAGLHAFEDHERPIDDLERFALSEYQNRSRYCLKPAQAVCTLLLVQKQIGGAALATKEIRVRTVPATVAEDVAGVLNENTRLPDILFAKRGGDHWKVAESDEGPDWADIVLRFAPSAALKDVCKLVLGEDVLTFDDVEAPEFPFDLGFAPYAHLLDDGTWHFTPKPKRGEKPQPKKLWPLLLEQHVHHWQTHPKARKYAYDDVILLRKLYEHLGSPETDFDGELACQVASVRMAGLPIDQERLDEAIAESKQVLDSAELNVDSPKQVREYIGEALDELEAHVIAEGCNKQKLKNLIKVMVLDEKEGCCEEGCPRCAGTGFVGPGPMPVVRRAEHVLSIRKHRKKMQLYEKLQIAGAAFPSFKVVGTKSGRMSGADGLNYHGIDKSKTVRSIFSFTDGEDPEWFDDGWVVSGGDYDSQELAIAAAVMQDNNMTDELKRGKSLHGLFAEEAFGIPYKQIMKYKDDDSRPESKYYNTAKICVYQILYGASSFRLSMDLGVTVEEADTIIKGFFEKFPYAAQMRQLIRDSLKCLQQTEAGGRITVSQPEKTYIDSCFGFRRSFEIEMSVMKTLVDAMPQVERLLKGVPGKVIRKDKKGPQTYAKAVSSALYGASFSLQGKIIRAALNHIIQSAGRTCTLRVQHKIWGLQPVGIAPFRVKPLSVHDEIATASSRETADEIADIVKAEVGELTETVPLLSLGWGVDVGSWYGVKACEDVIRCGWGDEDLVSESSEGIENLDEVDEDELLV